MAYYANKNMAVWKAFADVKINDSIVICKGQFFLIYKWGHPQIIEERPMTIKLK